MSGTTKEPNVAGAFYPGEPQKLSSMLTEYLDGATAYSGKAPKAIIAPHAGYIYSGPIAATAYKAALTYKESIKRVVLLSPTHHFNLQGAVIPSFDHYRTPLGEVQVDRSSIGEIIDLGVINRSDLCFEREHALEVHLPFIQHIFGAEVPVLPIIVGAVTAEQMLPVFQQLSDEKTLFVISGDLSHFLPYDEAVKVDQLTANQLQELQFDQLTHDQSCGYYPLQGLLLWAQQEGLALETVDLRNSGDTAGDKERVVGYGAFVLS